MAMKYRAFWEALIISLFVFGLGFVLGILLENSRNQTLSASFLNSETDLLDAQILSSILDNNYSCEQAIRKNIEFGDKIYADSVKLDDYSEASQLSGIVIGQHRKYDLLRTIFWINSIKIKEQCGARYHTVVYLYDYQPADLSEKSKQEVFSAFLGELKQDLGNEIILIPIAKNMEIYSLDLMLQKYSISQTSIILDENKTFDSVEDLILLKQELEANRISIALN